jgi:hypothetical protein
VEARRLVDAAAAAARDADPATRCPRAELAADAVLEHEAQRGVRSVRPYPAVDLQPIVLHVRDGELIEDSSWVYVWLRPVGERRVVYVGGTGLAPATRVWLHLHHDDPEKGRVKSAYPAAGGELAEALDVHAFRMPDAVPRRAVRDAVIRRLAAAGELSLHYCGFPAVEADESPEVATAASAVITRLPLR